MVKEITGGFTRMACFEENENFKTYCGYLSDHHSQVLVRRFIGQLDCVLKVEKKAALFMHHKNILGLSGYYKGKNGTVLVYPFTRRWTLDRFLHEKIKIAIGIGEGVRYMHEECPRGPVVHDDLRFWHIDPSNLESLAFLKSNIIHFEILLLRLFCIRSAPQDDKIFVDWARPLLLQRAFHKLLDEDMEDLDVYEIFRLMCVAAQCINTKPISRSSMSEIISVLKRETSCAMQLSPSSEGNPNMEFSGSSIAADKLKSMETEPEKHGYNKDGLVGASEVAFSSWLDYKESRGKPWRCKKMICCSLFLSVSQVKSFAQRACRSLAILMASILASEISSLKRPALIPIEKSRNPLDIDL
ncbi:hypothetical protein HYC85_011154 [Camellia sinensis]|uniref:Serine-threonine/tyrosine-protein kinase catalytic domain-containing protein n=1 Tax=Camellia sinensis TaxID=4442 RepID=A0A7J7HJZ6_CAMSI|nr:hypothetical protein HYC85_011154 [Camellia sinensis]